MWLCAWVVVLAHNYKKKLPIPTFGRLVEYEKQPVFYQLLFVALLLMGCFVALCTLLVHQTSLISRSRPLVTS